MDIKAKTKTNAQMGTQSNTASTNNKEGGLSVEGLGRIDLKDLENERENVNRSNTKRYQGFVTSQVATSIFNKFQTDKGFKTIQDAFVTIAILLQQGGSNQSGLDQINFTYKGITATARDLQSTLTKIGRKTTARQLARTYANEIYEICILFGIEGDLAKKRKQQVETQTFHEGIWASNFQTHNPNCPMEVRKWLLDNYYSRFEK